MEEGFAGKRVSIWEYAELLAKSALRDGRRNVLASLYRHVLAHCSTRIIGGSIQRHEPLLRFLSTRKYFCPQGSLLISTHNLYVHSSVHSTSGAFNLAPLLALNGSTCPGRCTFCSFSSFPSTIFPSISSAMPAPLSIFLIMTTLTEILIVSVSK
ncbi:hypothetical protein H4582DRAFT_2016940, partial [Lactarius indigo]